MRNKILLNPSLGQCICLTSLLGWASVAWAQAPDSVSEKDFLGDMPIVLSVSRLPQRLDETPGAVTVLDREMIRLSGARDVADLMRLVPGFQTSTSFETGAPIASYHGGFDGYSNRLQVLVDGRSVYSPFFIGSVGPGLQTVALADIDRIEVLRGSNSAAYGARAMLGVINIVTRHTQETLGVQAALTSGGNGVDDAQARIGWGKDDASYRLTADRRADDGLKGSNGHNQIDRVNFRADLSPNGSNEIQVRAGMLGINSGKGFAGLPTNPLRDSSINSDYVQLDWRHILGEDEDLTFNLAHTQEVFQDGFQFSLPPPFNDSIVIDSNGHASNDTLSLQHSFRYGSTLRIVWGGELRNEKVVSKSLYNTDTPFVTDFSRLFGNAEWRLAHDWVLNAGGMLENNSVSGNSFAPRLMLNWHVTEGQTLRAGVSKAFRPPSTFEKFANIIYYYGTNAFPPIIASNGNVQQENMLTRELGYLGDFPKLRMNLDVRVFNEQINGMIRINTDVIPRDYSNSDNVNIRGLEYQLKWRPWAGGQIILNQSYTDITAFEPSLALSAPRQASSLTLFQKLPGGLDLSLMHQDSGTVVLQGAGFDDKVPMSRTDLRLGLPLRFGRNRGELAFVVQNLGSPYNDYAHTFYFEQRAFVTLRVEN